jgi:hypothetical protein
MTLRIPTHAVRRRPAAAFAVVALAAAVSAGCGGSGGSGSAGAGGQTAADFLKEVTTQFSRGQSGRLWDTLHPADQAVVSRARYTTCQSNAGFELQKIKVLDSYPDTVEVAGKATPSTAISVRVTSNDGVTTATMHAISVNGKWRWMLSPAEYASYKQGKCPPSS